MTKSRRTQLAKRVGRFCPYRGGVGGLWQTKSAKLYLAIFLSHLFRKQEVHCCGFYYPFFRFPQDLVRMSSLLSSGCPPGRAGSAGGGGGGGGAGGWALRARRPRWSCTRHVVHGTDTLHRTRYVIQRTYGTEQLKHTEGQVGWAEHKAEQEAQLSPTSAAAAPRTSRSNPEPFNAQRCPPHPPPPLYHTIVLTLLLPHHSRWS